MGWRASETRELIFDECRVPKENMLVSTREGICTVYDGPADQSHLVSPLIPWDLPRPSLMCHWRMPGRGNSLAKSIGKFQAIPV